VTSRASGGALMPRKKSNLLVRTTYESNRLAKSYLAAAYETLMPKIQISLKTDGVVSHQVNEIPIKQSRGGSK